MSSAAGNSNSVHEEQKEEEEEGELYQLWSPYYSPEHPPEFYEDG